MVEPGAMRNFRLEGDGLALDFLCTCGEWAPATYLGGNQHLSDFLGVDHVLCPIPFSFDPVEASIELDRRWGDLDA